MKKTISNLFRGNVIVLFCSMLMCCIPLSFFAQKKSSGPPNFIIIFADDLGYGDLGSYGHPTIATPHLDQMVREGQKWTNFYAAASVCTPSRASILTGRLSVRNGMASHKRRVLYPDSSLGLPEDEITLAEQLKTAGYKTACIGKWHLGHKKEYLPTSHGFDYYFGIPYSNDMNLEHSLGWREYWQQPDSLILTTHFNVPLIRNTEEIERPANQHTITKRYAEETIKFIEENKSAPFFVYLAHNLPHIPLFVSEDFKGKSRRGLYGDVIEEIDNGVGKILSYLRKEGLHENTIVVFTSDNGPWLTFKENGGSAGPFYAGKGTTWEGGMRVPGIFWCPGMIDPGVRRDIGSTMDIYATFIDMAGLVVPKDRIIDGVSIKKTLLNGNASTRKSLFYYRGTDIYAVRIGDYKAHYITQGEYGEYGEKQLHDPPLLYNLVIDPSESKNIADKHPVVLDEIQRLVDKHNAKLVAKPDQLSARE